MIVEPAEKEINSYDSDSKRHGLWKTFYHNGGLFWESNYVNGKLHGESISYYKDGKIEQKGSYVDNAKHGYWEEYTPSGEPKYKGYYDKGNRVERNTEE
jgi:antitoxin component YwqK of YwqJK toxin-antitoxin module